MIWSLLLLSVAIVPLAIRHVMQTVRERQRRAEILSAKGFSPQESRHLALSGVLFRFAEANPSSVTINAPLPDSDGQRAVERLIEEFGWFRGNAERVVQRLPRDSRTKVANADAEQMAEMAPYLNYVLKGPEGLTWSEL